MFHFSAIKLFSLNGFSRKHWTLLLRCYFLFLVSGSVWIICYALCCVHINLSISLWIINCYHKSYFMSEPVVAAYSDITYCAKVLIDFWTSFKLLKDESIKSDIYSGKSLRCVNEQTKNIPIYFLYQFNICPKLLNYTTTDLEFCQ